MFDAYDTDGSGTLTPDEVYNIFKASLASKGEAVGTQEIREMVLAPVKRVSLGNCWMLKVLWSFRWMNASGRSMSMVMEKSTTKSSRPPLPISS